MREAENAVERFVLTVYLLRSVGRLQSFNRLGRPELDRMLDHAIIELDLDPSLTEQYVSKGLDVGR